MTEPDPAPIPPSGPKPPAPTPAKSGGKPPTTPPAKPAVTPPVKPPVHPAAPRPAAAPERAPIPGSRPAKPPAPAPSPRPATAPIPSGASRPADAHPWLGRTIARCKVGDRIGRGATSHVFRATYLPLHKEIALKILSGDRALDAGVRARFLAEAKAIARLDDENIVKVLDVVEDQGCLCILMEYVPGQTLQDTLDDERVFAPKRALQIALQIARALESAHAESIVHRDIKPANVMLARPGERVKVVDFGLASRSADNRVGTPIYMSPEAAQGKRIDEKSDVYALGICLYQMLTGQVPFTGSTVKEILKAHVDREAPPPSQVRRELGVKYDALIAKLLVKSKGYRPDAADAAEEIADLLDEPRPAGGGSRRPRRRPAKRKSATPLVLSLVGVVVLAIVAAIVVKGGSEPPPAGPTAPTTAPPPAAADPAAAARAAYDAAEAFAASRPDDFAAQVREWSDAERRTSGTEWAAKAAAKRAEAEAAAAKRKAADEERDREQAAKAAKEAEVAKAHTEVVALCKACDFTGASSRADRLGAPAGTTTTAWNKKVARLRFLAEHFVPRMDEQLKGSPIPASRVRPAAGEDERISGANRGGLVTDKGTGIAWKDVSADDLFHKVAKKVFAQSRPEDNLFLAALAAELGLDREARMFKEQAQLTDAAGTVADRLRTFFD